MLLLILIIFLRLLIFPFHCFILFNTNRRLYLAIESPSEPVSPYVTNMENALEQSMATYHDGNSEETSSSR